MKKYFDIFVRFCRVGALTFGGGLSMLPIIERELSEGEKPYLEKIEENNLNQGKNGHYFGHGLRKIATIRNILIGENIICPFITFYLQYTHT